MAPSAQFARSVPSDKSLAEDYRTRRHQVQRVTAAETNAR